jgi:hypothetical protein
MVLREMGFVDTAWIDFAEANKFKYGENSYLIARNAFYSAFIEGYDRGWQIGVENKIREIKNALGLGNL